MAIGALSALRENELRVPEDMAVAGFDENTALLTYRAEQDTMCGKSAVPSPAWVSSLFVRRNGKWVNALYQHTKAE
jgi:hypothetical protein